MTPTGSSITLASPIAQTSHNGWFVPSFSTRRRLSVISLHNPSETQSLSTKDDEGRKGRDSRPSLVVFLKLSNRAEKGVRSESGAPDTHPEWNCMNEQG